MWITVDGMRRMMNRAVASFAVLGVMAVCATGVSADQPAGLSFACGATPQVAPERAAEVCADFLDAVQRQPDLATAVLQDAPLSGGPGLEIEITRATDTRLEVVPTWIDRTGQRAVMPSAGLLTMDTTLTKTKRQAFFVKLIADLPR
jgi:hypothetical protein